MVSESRTRMKIPPRDVFRAGAKRVDGMVFRGVARVIHGSKTRKAEPEATRIMQFRSRKSGATVQRVS